MQILQEEGCMVKQKYAIITVLINILTLLYYYIIHKNCLWHHLELAAARAEMSVRF